jgi:uncharacterized protein YecT (DUF1311 family)
MKHLAMLMAGLSLCVVAPALSAQRPAKPIKLPAPCSSFSNSQQAAACYNTRLGAATASLEAAITDIKTKGKFDPNAPSTKTFDLAYDFWLKEMNVTCQGVAQFHDGGTLAMAEPIRCKVEMTEAREVLLRSLYRSVLKN